MTGLITMILDAKTAREVDRIVEQNIFQLPGCQRSKFCQFAYRWKAYLTGLKRLESAV